MVVGAIFVARVMKLTRHISVSLGDDAERSGHAEMHQQYVAGSEIGHQIFGAAAEPGDGLTVKPADEISLKRESEVFAPDFGFFDPRPFHGRLQSPADGLNFG